MEPDDRRVKEGYLKTILSDVTDFERDGLKETPARYLKFLHEFCSYDEPKYTTFESESYDQMIVQTDIPFYSLCEHHVVPFFGVAAVAYLPNKKIVGLSKIARTVEYYSRNLQNQERITTQVAERLSEELSPFGVGVILKARHMCMEMRGVKKPGTFTTTSALLGVMRSDENARQEFLSFVRNG